MAAPIRSITIVGGGSAGWLTAAFLNRVCRAKDSSQKLEITLIESPRVPPIGVGEATVAGMVLLLRQLEISEAEFFRRTDAAFKVCADFVNWSHTADGKPIEFVNILNAPGPIDGRLPAEYFVAMHPSRDMDEVGMAYARICSPVVEILKAGFGPRHIGAAEYSGEIGYSYHFDAAKLADLLKEVATKRGVKHVLDDVDGSELDERGFIKSLKLREHGDHPVELVIDCTGFRGALLQQALGESFLSYEDYLLNDRAAVVQFPHADPKQIDPSTRALGLSAGWNFRIPLFSRIGTGYVFSSKFISDDEAIGELLKLYGDQAKGTTPRIIRMRTGRVRNSWVKNCIALGLSSGFIEPLEATAIFMTDMAVRWLYHYMPSRDFEPELAAKYNGQVATLFDEVRDFVQLHYHLSNRKDTPYWQAAREEVTLSPVLEENLKVWQHTLPQEIDLPSSYLFDNNVYALVLIAKGFYRGRKLNTQQFLDGNVWRRFLRAINDAKRLHLEGLPSHYELLKSIRDGVPAALAGKTKGAAQSKQVQGPTVRLPGQPLRPDIRFKR